MELHGISGIAAKLLYRKASQRLLSLTEEEVRGWRAGSWRIAEEVMVTYRDRLAAHRDLALMAIDAFPPEEISAELVRRRPDLAQYWTDETFFRRLKEEKEALRSFLLGCRPDGPPGT